MDRLIYPVIYNLGFALTLFAVLPIGASEAVRLRDGKTYFNQVPQLVDAYTTQNLVNVTNAVYYFKVSVPKDAGESLQRLEIKPYKSLDDVNFEVDNTVNNPTGIAIAQDQDKNITVVFNPAIAPGETINIPLRAVRNPRYGGVYLFAVTAFPQGDTAHGQFLGYGRLNFYDSDRFGY
ncbi:Protein of unknown function (DUF2808) [Synechococcus sp. PCC 7502]|uniref:DUF2808 domain-containing protein n=1 Tax=Synechococcus sp. PCC 7502 TaxID=1173263 RepID=UPI00029F8456|nr:DUF2808 domain-containing protein [Synechococcus sp. PCC 7502]AFY74110.1 Protein of unknown function (DUF2808) [Synechococcus sp. PCC 7502]